MLTTVWAVVHEGKIELLEQMPLPEGSKVLVTVMSEEDDLHFWMTATQTSFDKIWDNPEDDVYAELLKE